MKPVLKSVPEYQIQLQQQSPYPFNGPKPPKFVTTVKLALPFHSLKDRPQAIDKIISLQSEHIIKINKITESHLHRNYTFIYEYVPFKVGYVCPEIQEFVRNKLYRAIISEVVRELIAKGIKPNLHADNFGFSNDFKLKIFIHPNCEILQPIDQAETQRTINYYTLQYERFFQNKQINYLNQKLKSKLTDLSQKIKKLNQGILLKDFKKREKKQSQSIKNSSDNSDSLAKTGSNQKIGNAQWQFDHDFHFEDSYSERDAKKQKKKRSASFKDGQKPKSENKQKKASWGQERTSVIQSDKVTVLKKRISEALFKTQKALTKYEKIRSRSSKKKGNQ